MSFLCCELYCIFDERAAWICWLYRRFIKGIISYILISILFSTRYVNAVIESPQESHSQNEKLSTELKQLEVGDEEGRVRMPQRQC